MQVRAEVIQAENSAGDAYNATEALAGQNDTADMYLRRFRPIFKGSYQDTWLFSLGLAADQWGRTNSSNALTLDHGWLGAKYDAFGWKHQTSWGKQQSDFNSAGARTAACLFPTHEAGQLPHCACITRVGQGFLPITEQRRAPRPLRQRF
jgi:hypothetical protein